MKLKSVIIPFLASILCCSCIENDLPYPTVVPKFKSISVEGADTVSIDAAARKISVVLNEETDISKVKISDVSFDNSMTVRMSPELNGTFNLKEKLDFTLSTYQDYAWTLETTQPIDYWFSVEKQVGEATVDDVNHRVVAKVGKGTRLSNIKVVSYKLGPVRISSYSKELYDITDFSEPVFVDVTAWGKSTRWTIFIEESDISVELKSLDAWTRVAYLAASGVAGRENGFRYRKEGETQWIEVPVSQIVFVGGNFSAVLDGLEPLTAYECLAYSGSDESDIRRFTTEAEQQLPNSGFEIYSNAESKNYYSWWDTRSSLCNTKWWDSGNQGSTMVGESAAICTPDTKDKAEGKTSARLNSRYVVIKFAAGNIFCGEFAGLEGLSGGKVNFGRPFTLRPRKLSLMLKYQPGNIDNINGCPEGEKVAMGDPDRCQIYIALGTWDHKKYGGTADSPVQVNTTRKETFFNPNGPDVIGYGTFITNKNTGGWTRVEIPIEYKSTSKMPTHIIVSCAASMLGDYFTGASSSTLWLDDFKLEY